jgi:hypothetical protein
MERINDKKKSNIKKQLRDVKDQWDNKYVVFIVTGGDNWTVGLTF